MLEDKHAEPGAPTWTLFVVEREQKAKPATEKPRGADGRPFDDALPI